MKSMWSNKKPKYFKVINDFDKQSYPKTFTYLLFDMARCEKPFDVFKNIQIYFDLTHRWILMIDKVSFANMAAESRTIFKAGIDSDVTVAVFEQDTAVLYQPYKIKIDDDNIGNSNKIN